jgi:uncharacterized surface protein with fasciclin (FAS1) repeats
MNARLLVSAGLMALSVAGVATAAQEMPMKTVMVGGESMLPSKNIIANAVNSKDHTTLVAAVKAAGLVDTLQGKGPFTVFAPTNAAFAKLPAGTVDTLLKPENKPMLTKILTYHVVAGRFDAETLMKKVRDGKGVAELATVSGGKLWVKMNGPRNLVVSDEKGMTSEISTYDVTQSNGVIHVITSVLMPS